MGDNCQTRKTQKAKNSKYGREMPQPQIGREMPQPQIKDKPMVP